MAGSGYAGAGLPLLIAVILLFVFAAPAAAQDCPRGARCGTVTVPLDHSGAKPGTLSITYSLLPATGPRTGTLVFLAGGPGQAGVLLTEELGRELAPVRATHDLVIVDQRGTGRSDAVECDEMDPGATDDCARELGDKRLHLTTAATARDLEHLRVALGVERLSLLGVSYGTKVAGEYARRFPERTAAVVLDSPAPLDGWDLVGTTLVRTLPRVLRETCSAAPCAETVGDAGAALNAAVRRVQRRAVPGRIRLDGRPRAVRVTEDVLVAIAVTLDFDPIARADLPAALASLRRGDAAPVLHLLQRSTDFGIRAGVQADEDSPFTWSRFLATACVEGRLPWAPTSDPSTRRAIGERFRAQSRAAYAPFTPAAVWRQGSGDICQRWPVAPAPEALPALVSEVPALILSGRADLRTPLESATEVAKTYTRPTLLDFPHVGHSVITDDVSGCAVERIVTFLAGGVPESCATRTRPVLGPAAYRAATISTLRAPRARSAAAITLEGVQRDVQARLLLFQSLGEDPPPRRWRVHGLRGGSATVIGGRVRLRDVESIVGVRVSGTLSAAGTGRVTVSGPARLRGSFRVRRFAPAGGPAAGGSGAVAR